MHMRDVLILRIMYMRRGNRRQSYLVAENSWMERMPQYEMNCRCCGGYHSNRMEKCYVMCTYCHSIHLRSQLPEEYRMTGIVMCPQLKKKAKDEQQRQAFRCQDCDGEGEFDKLVEMTKLEKLDLFQKRKQQYYRRWLEGASGLPVPERRVFTRESMQVRQRCNSCSGKGLVFRMVACCENGCHQCGFSHVRINPKWREFYLRGQANEKIFTCQICMKTAEIGDRIFKLKCDDAFHRACIFPWMYRYQKCKICQKPDVNLEREDIPMDQRWSLDVVQEREFFVRREEDGKIRLSKFIQEEYESQREVMRMYGPGNSQRVKSECEQTENQAESMVQSNLESSLPDINTFSDSSFVIGGPPLLLAEEPMDLDLSAIQKKEKGGRNINNSAVLVRVRSIPDEPIEANTERIEGQNQDLSDKQQSCSDDNEEGIYEARRFSSLAKQCHNFNEQQFKQKKKIEFKAIERQEEV